MTKSCVESYIVRVYRRDGEDPEGIVGLVEVVQTGEVRTFAGRAELCGVICRRPRKRDRAGKAKGAGDVNPSG